MDHKKVLILTGSIGEGHMSAAKAVKQAMEKQGLKINVEIVDIMEFLNAGFNKISQKTYDGASKFAPFFLKFCHETIYDKWPLKFMNQLNYPFMLSKIKKLFDETKPDLILSTFPVWDYIIAEIWRKQRKNAKFVSLVTDSIAIHRGWVIANADYHIVANRDTALSLKAFGVKDKKIKSLGFPVKLGFTTKTDREKLLNRLNLNPDLFTILFLPTAQNPSKNIKFLKELQENQSDYNLIIVCGRDKEIKDKLNEVINKDNTALIGWTEDMPEYIKSSDIVVTKAGGATIMECIAAEKPMVITSTIPGQEEGNAELIKRHQLGIVIAATAMSISESIEFIRRNYPLYQRNLKKHSKPDAAFKIAEFISNLLQPSPDRN